jgi:putative DNA-invertase from lambdoid prophage Rac
MTTPMGRMLAHFLAAAAEFERVLIGQRVRSGFANAKAKGKRLGRPPTASSQVEKELLLSDQGESYKKAAKQSRLSVSNLIRARRKRKGI